MSLIIPKESGVTTPATDKGNIYLDEVTNKFKAKIDTGTVYDITLPTATSGKQANFDGTNWIAETKGGGSTSLTALTDTTLGTLSSGHYLNYNGTAWVNASRYLQPSGYQVPSGVYKIASEFYQPSGYQVPSGNYATVSQGHSLWAASGNYAGKADDVYWTGRHSFFGDAESNSERWVNWVGISGTDTGNEYWRVRIQRQASGIIKFQATSGTAQGGVWNPLSFDIWGQKVGIADPTPSYTFDVNGDVNSQTALRYQGEDTDERYALSGVTGSLSLSGTTLTDGAAMPTATAANHLTMTVVTSTSGAWQSQQVMICLSGRNNGYAWSPMSQKVN